MTNNKSLEVQKYVVPKGYILKIGDFPAKTLHDSIIESATQLPLDKTNDTVALMLERTFEEQRTKDIQKISFHSGIPVEDIEGWLRSRDE